MKTYDIPIPQSLDVMTPEELQRVLVTSAQRILNKSDVVDTLQGRYPTKRSTNAVANNVDPHDLAKLHESMKKAAEVIDLDDVYHIVSDPHRAHCTIKQ